MDICSIPKFGHICYNLGKYVTWSLPKELDKGAVHNGKIVI